MIDDDGSDFCAGAQDAGADPFCERLADRRHSVCRQILGGCFRFESTSEALLDLVEAAYAGLPSHQLPLGACRAYGIESENLHARGQTTTISPADSRSIGQEAAGIWTAQADLQPILHKSDRLLGTPEFRIELRLLPRQTSPNPAEPPPVRVQSGAGLLCGVMDASNYVVLAPEQHRALVVASEDMLDHPYHLRYELIEFAVFTLATRGLGLVPLHGACVGWQGRGILLLGASGSGKSTLALHSLLQGMDFLAEDAVFVQPESMLATGVANYLHVQADALRFIDDDATRRWISQAPVIRRRSGAEKFEADLRQGRGRLATAPLELVGAVFASAQLADDPEVLSRVIPQDEIVDRLRADQAYASGQPGWRRFEQRMTQLGVHQLHRGRHPRDAVTALRRLLE